MARDLFHENVKEALIKEGWIITNGPLSFKIGNMQVQIDLFKLVIYNQATQIITQWVTN